jgi:ABC-2 type transport system ATP-binding protein
MSQPAITAENLLYRYGDLVAVNQINFQVEQGEILGFLGPNGAGKSTVVKMLSGQLRPKGGVATVLGLDVALKPKQVQAQAGICFEITNLYEDMSATANLKLFARLFNLKDF